MQSPRPRIAAAARWLAPSAVAACAGALAAGAVDGAGASSGFGALAAAGFVALPGVPLLLAGGAIARAVTAAWRPRELIARLTEDGGGAPRLAGWVAVIWLAAFALAGLTYRATWLLAATTAFKPLAVGYAAPVLVAAAALALVAVSYPAARALTALARRIDARWRGRGHRTLLRPRVIFAGAGLAATAACAAEWLLVIRPRLGPLDVSGLYAPAAGVAAAIAVHLAWPRLGRARAIGGPLVAAAALAAVALALAARVTRPALTLELWGDRQLAGLAIERLFELDAIRADVSLAQFRPVERPGAAHPDIVLVTIDSLRADRTPPYGGATDMPALGGIAARGSVFEWAFAPSNVTRRSIPSMMTGLAPDRIRGRVVGWALRVDPRHVLLAERMRAGGYDTAGFMCCPLFWGSGARTGLERGLEHLVVEPNGPRLAQLARVWIEVRARRGAARPLFVWMHVIEPHNWTRPAGDPRNGDDRRRSYDRTLAAADAMLAELVRPFAGRSADRAPIVIVTSDHGEALGEHGQPNHSTDLYNSQLRVPFVIAGPGIARQRIAETVSLTDLAPTVLELAGFDPTGDGGDGGSLAGLATGARASSPSGIAYAAMIKDRSSPGGITAIVRGNWKLIETATDVELYDVHADPDERTSLAAARPELVRELRALLEARRAAAQISPFGR